MYTRLNDTFQQNAPNRYPPDIPVYLPPVRSAHQDDLTDFSFSIMSQRATEKSEKMDQILTKRELKKLLRKAVEKKTNKVKKKKSENSIQKWRDVIIISFGFVVIVLLLILVCANIRR